MVEAYVGVDIGTGSARAGVFDASGQLLASARRPIAIWHEPGEIVEHSSSDIWAAATGAVREAVGASGLSADEFAGIGFDATCSLVVLDAAGNSLAVGPSGTAERDTIVWMDHRAMREAEAIDASGHEVLRYVGGKISPEMEAPKLVWLARHMPQTFARAAHFFDLTDFLTWRATGDLTRSLCTVTCKWTYLAHEGRWAADFFDTIGLGALARDNFSRIGAKVAPPGAPLGRGLTKASAAAMGLPEGLPVGAGLIDAHAGAVGTLGAGIDGGPVDPLRRLALILGTSACCMALADKPRFIKGVWGPLFSVLTAGHWLTEGGQSAFGAAIDHLMKMHPRFAEISKRANGHAFELMERDIFAQAGSFSSAALLSSELHVLPDFLGNRSPYADSNARGALFGLDLRDDYASLLQFYVAGLTGLAHGLAQVIRTLEAGGFDFDRLVVSGGAARSGLVRQLIADSSGKMVSAPLTSEPVLLGAAMLGAVAAGRHTLQSAMSGMSSLAEQSLPQQGEIAAFHRRKRRAFEAIQQAEQSVRGVMNASRG
jgi:D-ribulokinase